MTLRRIAAVTGVCLLAACDIPTDIPIVDQEWVVPIKTATISVSQLLPSGVSVTGTRFAVTVPSFATTKTLGELCGCSASGTGPAPALNASFTTTQSLPANVTGGDIASGTVNIAVQNGFSFDPTTNGGSVTVTLNDGAGGRELGKVTISGGQLPAGQTTTRSLTLATGNVGATLVATTVIASPGGQQATINTNQQLTVTATPQNLQVGSARVNVAGKAVNIDPIDLDVKDVDSSVTDHLQEGSLIIDVANPFGVGLTSTLRINYPGGSITKTITLTNAATQTIRLSYTKQELLQFLGKDNVTLTGTGAVAGNAAAITVTPTQQVQLKAKLDAKIQLGGEN